MQYINTKRISLEEQAPCLESLPLLNYASMNKAQRVLWSYFFFRALGLNLRMNVEVNVLVKFLHLTNGELLDSKNTYFYKLAWKAPHLKTEKRLIHDLNVVREHFVKYGLPTTDIDHEIANIK